MKKYLSILLFLFILNFSFAQSKYFQQEVNTKIDVILNDSSHTLNGTIEIEYINNSPDDLNEIYIHLWANAYKNRKTAFAKQKVSQGSGSFYFAKGEELGRFKKLNFTVDNNTVEWNYHNGQADIAVLKLVQTLKPGDRITIKTPLNLNIPASFSRLGHVGESYQLTQWFPKPAVYDKTGWHPMSYVDMGEFYSEFGSYDVKITLPENYVVGSTGVLQNESEKTFLQKRINETSKILAGKTAKDFKAMKDTFPDSSPNMKTLHYKAEQVHDFAIFADKRFYVQKSEVTLASGKKVDTWAMFTNAEAEMWKKGIFYVDRSVKFYSKHVGEYPYPHATAVQSALSAGGGMEYPMITVIGLMGDPQSLDGVITHEVGHNWFYGILAFNERDHVWMDEGMNSYYDHRYTEQYYEGESIEFLPDFMMKNTDYGLLELAYLYQARRNADQAPATHSEEYSRINYFLGGYEKPAVSFKILEKYLGTSKFDEIMKSFYEAWKFKHPDPTDFRSHVEARTDKNLSWFFDGLINSNKKTDYAFKRLNSGGDNLKLKIKNKEANPAPFPVMAMKDSTVVRTEWFDGFTGSKELAFPKGDYDKLIIDKDHLTLDLYRQNNTIKTSGLFKKMAPINLQFLTGVENSKKNTLFWLPLIAWNNYDKTMLGLGLYNSSIPSKRFEFALAPMYSIASGDVVGVGRLRLNAFPNTDFLKKVSFGLGAKTFNSNYSPRHKYYSSYRRLMPSLTVELGAKANKSFAHRVNLRSLWIWEENGVFEQDSTGTRFTGTEYDRSVINEISYAGENNRAVNPFSFKLALEQQKFKVGANDENYLKATLDLNLNYTYAKGKNVSFRIFGGYFLKNTRRDLVLASDGFARGNIYFGGEGSTDYRYDDFYLDRNATEGIFSQQIHIRDGGFKNALRGQTQFGDVNDYLFALNIKGDLPKELPFNLPLKPYFDVGYMNDSHKTFGELNASHTYYSGGLMLDFFNGILGVYFPIVNSKALKDDYGSIGLGTDAENSSSFETYLKRITFSLDINRANPFELIDKIQF